MVSAQLKYGATLGQLKWNHNPSKIEANEGLPNGLDYKSQHAKIKDQRAKECKTRSRKLLGNGWKGGHMTKGKPGGGREWNCTKTWEPRTRSVAPPTKVWVDGMY